MWILLLAKFLKKKKIIATLGDKFVKLLNSLSIPSPLALCPYKF